MAAIPKTGQKIFDRFYLIWREFLVIPLNRLVEDFRLNAVNFGEIGVEDHALISNCVDDRIDGGRCALVSAGMEGL